MKLDKLTIGSLTDSPKHQFKNLKNVTIDFDQGHWVTVVIGWNGTGKSNVLEALAIIFRDLIAEQPIPEFAFQLAYRMGSGDTTLHIHIDADPDRESERYIIHVATNEQVQEAKRNHAVDHGNSVGKQPFGEKIKLSVFLKAESEHLPRYVFSYYSGESTRMREIFLPYLKDYYEDLLKSKKDPAPKRLFYALPVHSQFVLLAFLIRPDQMVKDFLFDQLGIDPEGGVESVLFVLRKPPWKSTDGDPRFWFARGLVQRFLDRLMRVALAPISIKRAAPKSIWNKNGSRHEYKYLYVKDIDSLRDLVGDQSPNEFFRDLESTYVSELIEEVRIHVRLNKNDGSVTFRELSEGEQQLLTVLGLLRFTAKEESLFLLDEPDTHLNPRWCVNFLSYLSTFVGQSGDAKQNSHILLTTHNPLAIAELEKEQVQILYRNVDTGTVHAENPSLDPKGMGFAGIVTSDMFGLGSSLDKATNDELLELHELSTKKQTSLDETDRARLVEIRERLEGLDFNFASRDRLEQEYLRARFDLAADDPFDEAILTPENKQKALDALVLSLLGNLRERER
ncbi:ATP-binding protein [Rhodanobacter sp. L36]|uniref:AAA family ATPase n=1 Tax=Rhodanobacter sp. L36 TaxID=1747221 RepID=UPI00131CB38C|nr:ATP-binding protein [Rhodanobacter sp. L36]